MWGATMAIDLPTWFEGLHLEPLTRRDSAAAFVADASLDGVSMLVRREGTTRNLWSSLEHGPHAAYRLNQFSWAQADLLTDLVVEASADVYLQIFIDKTEIVVEDNIVVPLAALSESEVWLWLTFTPVPETWSLRYLAIELTAPRRRELRQATRVETPYYLCAGGSLVCENDNETTSSSETQDSET